MIQFECRARQRGYQAIAGVDEAGRGPLAGPVVAAAVILAPDYRHPEINDSKKLAPGKRERLYEIIKADALAVGIGVIEAHVIDRMNILRATLMAMRDAVLDLSLPPDFLLIDGKNPIDVRTPQDTIIGGDGKSLSIAAASIIAKVSRDRIMEIYHRQFPQYNFLKNKGYGTGEHREAIHRCGPCKIHRLSFTVKSCVNHQPCLL
ncbi:MAG: ribonuclease HII [Syntrophus sp. (in: bacteria)]|nr:ribonuclease HII [Syntrophus sp. (in: bacteria)]